MGLKVLPPNILKRMVPADRAPLGKSGLLPEEIDAQLELRLEKELQQQIMNWLELHGVFAGRQRMDRKSSLRAGWPDLVFAWQGTPIALECKLPGRKQTVEQLEAERRMKRDGWLFFVVHSLVEVIELLLPVKK